MSDEYALVSDASGEVYVLGRGPWYEWSKDYPHTFDERSGPPASRADVDALLAHWQEGWSLGLQPTWALAVAEDIWNFFERNRAARLVGDDDQTLESPSYRKIGSRYEHERLITRRNPAPPARCSALIFADQSGKRLEPPRQCARAAKVDGLCSVHRHVKRSIDSTEGGFCAFCAEPGRRYEKLGIAVSLCALCSDDLTREIRKYVPPRRRRA